MISAIETIGLTKIYTGRGSRNACPALDAVSFAVEAGQIIAILGLNGAGKSTLIKILLDLVRPTSGEAFLFGKSVRSHLWKELVGYLPESFQPPPGFTARTLLHHLGRLSGLHGRKLADRTGTVLGLVGLTENRSQRIRTLSKGMLVRLGIAQAFLHEPRLLFLDEPTEGLDPAARKLVRNLLLDLRANGTTVLLNSHLLSEIEFVADRVIILHRGKVVANGTLAELLPPDDSFEVESPTEPGIGKWEFRSAGSSWVCEVPSLRELNQLLSELNAKSIRVTAVKPKRTTLEDVFFSYVSGIP